MMAFTENALGDAIVTASNNGAEIQGVIDYVEYTGSEFDYLTDAGLDILEYNNHDASEWPDGATVHHKFAVTDAGETTATVDRIDKIKPTAIIEYNPTS
jgi:phosphatidylserine/phosphatidylglycerophosphate/cardiolipin synthase-like enzyme